MEEKVKKHLNNLFSEVKETDELNELKKNCTQTFFKDFLHGLKQILISKYGVTDAQSQALVVVIIFLGSVLLIALAGAFAFKVGAIVGEAQAHWKYGR